MADFPIVDLSPGGDDSEVSIETLYRAYEMAVEALEVIADERGIDDPMFRQFSVMCRIVARSCRKMVAGG
jgi:hypothetical protein